MNRIICVSIFVALLSACRIADALVPAGQSVGATLKEYENERNLAAVTKRLESEEAAKPSIYEEEIGSLPGGRKDIKIRYVTVQCDDTVPASVMKEARGSMEGIAGEKMTLPEMKKAVSDLSQGYAVQGIRAYVPKQSFKGGRLYINIVKGR